MQLQAGVRVYREVVGGFVVMSFTLAPALKFEIAKLRWAFGAPRHFSSDQPDALAKPATAPASFGILRSQRQLFLRIQLNTATKPHDRQHAYLRRYVYVDALLERDG